VRTLQRSGHATFSRSPRRLTRPAFCDRGALTFARLSRSASTPPCGCGAGGWAGGAAGGGEPCWLVDGAAPVTVISTESVPVSPPGSVTVTVAV
jgi:hypothetical protein